MELEARGWESWTLVRGGSNATATQNGYNLRPRDARFAGGLGWGDGLAMPCRSNMHSGQPGARREKVVSKEKKQERDAARASQDVVRKVRPVRWFTGVLARTLQVLQDTCSKGLVHGRNAVHRAAAAAVAIVRGRGEEEAGSAAQQLQAGSPLQHLAEPPSMPLPLLLPVEPRKVAIRTSCSARLFSSVEAADISSRCTTATSHDRYPHHSGPKQNYFGILFSFSLVRLAMSLRPIPPPKKKKKKKKKVPARLVLRTSGTAATWIRVQLNQPC